MSLRRPARTCAPGAEGKPEAAEVGFHPGFYHIPFLRSHATALPFADAAICRTRHTSQTATPPSWVRVVLAPRVRSLTPVLSRWGTAQGTPSTENKFELAYCLSCAHARNLTSTFDEIPLSGYSRVLAGCLDGSSTGASLRVP